MIINWMHEWSLISTKLLWDGFGYFMMLWEHSVLLDSLPKWQQGISLMWFYVQAWTSCQTNSRHAGELRCYDTHVMLWLLSVNVHRVPMALIIMIVLFPFPHPSCWMLCPVRNVSLISRYWWSVTSNLILSGMKNILDRVERIGDIFSQAVTLLPVFKNALVHTLEVETYEFNSSPLDKMDAKSQTVFSDAFSCMKSFIFWLKFHWNLFIRVRLTIT